MTSESWNILRLLNECTQFFRENNLDSPRLDAEILLAHALGLKRLDLYLRFDQPVADTEREKFRSLVRRRKQHEPIAYITGEREFWSLALTVGPGVLIPRPETELLVETVLAENKSREKKFTQGLEWCVGSAAVSLSLLKELPDLRMEGLDISKEALAWAKKNQEKFDLGNRLALSQEDVFSEKYFSNSKDLIIANPPYVTDAEWKTLSLDIKNFEPQMALVAGSEGLQFYHRLATRVQNDLSPGGFVVFEIGENQAHKVSEILKQAGGKNITVKKDAAGLDRVVSANF